MPALTHKLGLYRDAHECYRIFQTWTSYVCTHLGYLGLKLKPVVLRHAGLCKLHSDRQSVGPLVQTSVGVELITNK